MKFRLTILVVFFLFLQSFIGEVQNNAQEQVLKSIAAIEKLNTLSFHLEKVERFEDKIFKAGLSIHQRTKPYAVFLEMKHPHEGTQALFVEGKFSNEVQVKPSTFPYIGLALSPTSSLLMKDNHHTIKDIGFNYLANVLKKTIVTRGNELFKGATVEEIEFRGLKMHKVTIIDYGYKYKQEKISQSITLGSFAEQRGLSLYTLMRLNKMSHQDQLLGKTISLPTSFALKLIIYINPNNNLPQCQYIYDEQGLMESYEISELNLYPNFDSNEFTLKGKGYRF